MKSIKHALSSIILVYAVLFSPLDSVAAGETHQASRLFIGPATNGISAFIELISRSNQDVEIIVSVTNATYGGLFKGKSEAEQNGIFAKTSENIWKYYMATNLCFGHMELRDGNGGIVSAPRTNRAIVNRLKGEELLIHTDAVSWEYYPSTFSWEAAHHNYFARFKTGYMGPGVFPLPVFAVSSCDQLASFRIRPDPASKASLRLNDFFDLDKPGRYELTVWPVIYKARNTNGTNADICDRLLIPPVRALFSWREAIPE